MSCAVVTISPALGASHSPSIRQPEEAANLPLSGSSLDLPCSTSPLVLTTPKLSPMISVYRPPSPITLPSPRVQCSPRTPSWTSPVSTPSMRSSCLCGGFSICSSCSCTLASASPGELKWRLRDSLDKRGSAASCLSPPEAPSPSPRVGSLTRALNSTPRFQTLIEVPSPKFGSCNNLSYFQSTKFCPRAPTPSHGRTRPGEDDSANKENAGLENIESVIREPEDLRLRGPKNQDEAVLPLQTSVVEPSGKDCAGLNGRPSTPPLKRKRPPKLEIPQSANLVLSMAAHGVDLNEDAINDITFEGAYYGISCKKGRREHLEDTQRAIPDLHGDPSQAFFGVFDGHGGRKAANFAAEHLVHNIIDAMEKSDRSKGYMEAAVRTGYLTTDAEFLQKGVSSGASCVTALMRDGYLVVANAGDCRAVMSRAGLAEALTVDHRAGREDEKKRIEELGGYVDNLTGTWRVQGVLAVSRGIGDLHLKEWISAEPEVQKLRITPDCEFLILASDGLWDAVSNQEAVDFARVVLLAAGLNGGSGSPPVSGTASVAREGIATADDAQAFDQCACKPTDLIIPGGSTVLAAKLGSGESRRSPSAEDSVDISIETVDTGAPDTGIPETPAPAVGPVAACKRLLEIALERGCRDDISIIVVDLQHFCKLSQ
ncbi:hypothetical protein R1flu_002040 [Riccia fluitans]|uniref:protein-serine/threonine phosphatase n=1 Tax=Riccia fluitans TaxID=41844 RepID=A0ABD1Y557_9MARC